MVRDPVGKAHKRVLDRIQVDRPIFPFRYQNKPIAKTVFADLRENEWADRLLTMCHDIHRLLQHGTMRKRIPRLPVLLDLFVRRHPAPSEGVAWKAANDKKSEPNETRQSSMFHFKICSVRSSK